MSIFHMQIIIRICAQQPRKTTCRLARPNRSKIFFTSKFESIFVAAILPELRLFLLRLSVGGWKALHVARAYIQKTRVSPH